MPTAADEALRDGVEVRGAIQQARSWVETSAKIASFSLPGLDRPERERRRPSSSMSRSVDDPPTSRPWTRSRRPFWNWRHVTLSEPSRDPARLIRNAPALSADDQARSEKVGRVLSQAPTKRKRHPHSDNERRVTTTAAIRILKLSPQVRLADADTATDTSRQSAAGCGMPVQVQTRSELSACPQARR